MKNYNIPTISKKKLDLLLYNNLNNFKREGKIIEGKIIGISRDNIFIDIGLKSEGKIPKNEFNKEDILKIGSKIDVYFNSLENKDGCIQLSRKEVSKERLWKKFSYFNLKHKNINGKIIGKVHKGGFAVNIEGVLAFLPRSQLDTRQIHDVSSLINIEQPFKILKIDVDHGNIVVSRRAVLEELRKEAKSTLLSGIKEKMIFQGIVKNITNYGVFVDLGDIDGLLHITDISWSKISHPSEKINLGQKLKVLVTKYDYRSQRISLGLKQLFTNPWEDVKKKYFIGKKYVGIISNFSEHGVFIKLDKKVEGFVHLNEISWTNTNPNNLKELLNIGEETSVLVLDINLNKHRITLSIKQCKENPSEKFFNSLPVGSKISFKAKKVLKEGIYLKVSSELEKIIFILPFAEIIWEKNLKISLKNFELLDISNAVIVHHDLKNLRMIVSSKRLKMINHENNLSTIKFKKNILCRILGRVKDGFYLTIEEVNFIGFLKISNSIGDLSNFSYFTNVCFFLSELKFYDKKKKIFFITFSIKDQN